jgi:putative tricarboxylic transport membrane protein
VNNSIFDVGVLFFFGLLGYVLKKLNFELAPLILGFILGPLLELNARQALIMSKGDLSVFFNSTISTVLLLFSCLVILTALYSGIRRRKS